MRIIRSFGELEAAMTAAAVGFPVTVKLENRSAPGVIIRPLRISLPAMTADCEAPSADAVLQDESMARRALGFLSQQRSLRPGIPEDCGLVMLFSAGAAAGNQAVEGGGERAGGVGQVTASLAPDSQPGAPDAADEAAGTGASAGDGENEEPGDGEPEAPQEASVFAVAAAIAAAASAGAAEPAAGNRIKKARR